jgi:hypothetical protein
MVATSLLTISSNGLDEDKAEPPHLHLYGWHFSASTSLLRQLWSAEPPVPAQRSTWIVHPVRERAQREYGRSGD